MDFFTFHAALRLLQSNKLADIKDFVPEAPTAVDVPTWSNAAQLMSQLDSDRSGDLDKDEFEKTGDFSVADKDKDGYLTDVEFYRYVMEMDKLRVLRHRTTEEVGTLASAVKKHLIGHGVLPSTLNSLWMKPDDFPNGVEWVKCLNEPIVEDPWGTPYRYTTDGASFRIRSNGPDRQENTDDDIVNRE